MENKFAEFWSRSLFWSCKKSRCIYLHAHRNANQVLHAYSLHLKKVSITGNAEMFSNMKANYVLFTLFKELIQNLK